MPFVSDAQRNRLLYFANSIRASCGKKEEIHLPIAQRTYFIPREKAIRIEIRDWFERSDMPRPRLSDAEITELANELPDPPVERHKYLTLEELKDFMHRNHVRSIKHERLKDAGLLPPRKLSPKQRRKVELSGALVAAHLSI